MQLLKQYRHIKVNSLFNSLGTWPRRVRGAATTELIVVLLSLGPVALGGIQTALIFHAKSTLNYATFEAARTGSVRHAQSRYMRKALVEHLRPLYGGGHDTASLAESYGRARLDIMSPVVPGTAIGAGTKIEILSPTIEAFDDHGKVQEGEEQIPNQHLRYRARTVGSTSGVNIQDANILKIKVTYGYKLYVPVINKLIARSLMVFDAGNSQYYLADPPRLPIVAQATMRMQSNPKPDPGYNASSPGVGAGMGSGGGTAPPPGNDGGGNTGGGDDGGGGGDTGGGGDDTGAGGDDPGDDVADGGDGSDPCADGSCSDGNNSCTSDVASGGTDVASANVGNPINVVSGNKYQNEVDLSHLPGMLGLEFQRHYNSNGDRRGPLGYNWRHSYSVDLKIENDRMLSIRQADGRKALFEKTAGSVYRGRMARDGWVQTSRAGYDWRWRNGRELHFDHAGRMTHVIAPSGETVYFTYNKDNRLLQITDPQDRTLGFTYYNNGRIKALIDPAGRSIHYRYDSAGNLEGVRYPDNSERRYHYEDVRHPHKLTGITDARGIRYASYRYDASGRGIESTHSDNVGQVRLKYEKDRTVVTNSKGTDTIYHIATKSGIPLIRRITGADGSSCTDSNVEYRYNKRFQISQIVDHTGAVDSYYYDDKGRVDTIYRRAPGKKPMLVTSYSYQDDNIFPSTISGPSVAPGKQHQYELHYNAMGKVMRVIETGYRPVDGKGNYQPIYRVTNYHYRGRQLSAVDGPLPGKIDSVYYDYDDSDRLIKVRMPEGLNRRILDYDAYGRPTHLVDADGIATKLSYNYQGQITQLHKGKQRYEIEYDVAGHPTKVTRPDGSFLQAQYDDAGRLSRLLDAQGNAIQWQRDTEDKVVQIAIHNGEGAVSLSKDFVYDANNRLMRASSSDGSYLDYSYDLQGRLSSVINAAGHKRAYGYDAYGRVSQLIQASGSDNPEVTRIAYDPSGRQAQVTDAKQHSTQYLHDDFGNRVIVVNPDHGISVQRYDEAGNLIAKLGENGVLNYYNYDAAGRLISLGAGDDKPSLYYSYKGTKLIRIASELQVTDFAYDDVGNMTKQRKSLLGREFVTAYRYDPTSGKLSGKVLPDGTTLRYHYHESSGKLRAITRKDMLRQTPIVGELRYRPFGPLQAYTHGNGISTEKVFDAGGRLQRLQTTAVQQLAYSYDAAGNISAVQRNGEQESYDYDARGRLLKAKLAGADYAWSYDSLGNRVSQSYNGATQQYAYDRASSRLVSVQGETRSFNLYDRTGNPVIMGQRRYEYNAAGRPIAVYTDDKLTAMYLYNSLGQRIAKTVERDGKPVTTLFLYEANRIVAEADQKGRITAQYLYLGNDAIAKLEGDRIYAIHGDHLGTPHYVTDQNKAVVWQARYTPFGEAKILHASMSLNLRFPGQYYDVETGTHYNYYRDYDPATGRYLTPDPMGIAGGINTYAYAGANPLGNTDVYGLYSTEVHYYMTYFLARMAGIEAGEALTIALAAQYIDDNIETDPFAGVFTGALDFYHFTFDYDGTAFSGDPNDNIDTRFYKNGTLSPQQQNLRNAAVKEYYYPDEVKVRGGRVRTVTRTPVVDSNGNPVPMSRCARAQFYGEFVHAFQDSYSHRFEDNEPVPKWNWRGGLGHGLLGHEPDQTYSHVAKIIERYDGLSRLDEVETRIWTHNEARTLQMEKELFEMFQRDFRETTYDANDQPTGGGATDGGGDVASFDLTGQEITWERLAGNGRAEILTGATDAYGFPLDSDGNSRNLWGRIVTVDPVTRTVSTTGPVTDLNEIQWQRRCDVDANLSCGGGGVLQEYNKATTTEDKIDILNWALLDFGYEAIPEYNEALAELNREDYLQGLVVTSDFPGVILPQSYPLRDNP